MIKKYKIFQYFPLLWRGIKGEVRKKKIFSLLLILFQSIITLAQQNKQEVEMADQMRSSGKIYVVVTVLAVIFAGIIAYLVSIDRKLSKLEEDVKGKK